MGIVVAWPCYAPGLLKRKTTAPRLKCGRLQSSLYGPGRGQAPGVKDHGHARHRRQRDSARGQIQKLSAAKRMTTLLASKVVGKKSRAKKHARLSLQPKHVETAHHNARSESFTTSAEKEQGVRLTDLEATRYFFGTQWNRGILILPVHQTGRAMTRPRPVAGQIRLRPGVRDGRWVSSVNAAQTDAIPVRGFTVPVTEAIPRPETWCRLSDVRSP